MGEKLGKLKGQPVVLSSRNATKAMWKAVEGESFELKISDKPMGKDWLRALL